MIPAPLPSEAMPPPAPAEGPPTALAQLLDEFARTAVAQACARPAGAYANCLAASALCAVWLRENGVESGLLHLSGSRGSLGAGAGRWPFYAPAQVEHWTVRAGPWSIDWTARQFYRRASWPAVDLADSLATRWLRVDDWACHRCPQLVSDERHQALAPPTLHREHRILAHASDGRGPFRDPRHDDSAPLIRLCACPPAAPA
jgi:hypothetical protein